MSRRTIFVPIGTIAFSLPEYKDGKIVNTELIWLKPLKGYWVGQSEEQDVVIMQDPSAPVTSEDDVVY